MSMKVPGMHFAYVILLSMLKIQVHSCTLSDVQRLKKELLIDRGYAKSTRPLLNQSRPIQLDVFMTITGIQSMDISSGKLLSPGYLVASWTDEILIWNSSDFNGIERLSLSSEEIWLPMFVQFGATQSHITLTPAWLHANGTVVWIMAGLLEGTCQLDILKYPMDEHVCEFVANPSQHDTNEIQLRLLKDRQDVNFFTENGEWEVKKSISNVFVFVEPISNTEFTGISQTVTISRRSQFVMVHTGIPLFLLSLLNVGVFLVPLRSGERITFSTAILLNLVFFTTKMSEDLPHNSLRLSYCSIMMTTTNIITTLGVIFSVILCRIDHETLVPVPERLQNFVSGFIACRLRRHRNKAKVEDLKLHSVKDMDTISYIETPDSNLKITENDAVKDIPKTWSVVAEAFDIILFDLSLVALVIIAVVFSSLLFI